MLKIDNSKGDKKKKDVKIKIFILDLNIKRIIWGNVFMCIRC